MTSALTSVRFATSISSHIRWPNAAQRFTYRPRTTGGVGTGGWAGRATESGIVDGGGAAGDGAATVAPGFGSERASDRTLASQPTVPDAPAIAAAQSSARDQREWQLNVPAKYRGDG